MCLTTVYIPFTATEYYIFLLNLLQKKKQLCNKMNDIHRARLVLLLLSVVKKWSTSSLGKPACFAFAKRASNFILCDCACKKTVLLELKPASSNLSAKAVNE